MVKSRIAQVVYSTIFVVLGLVGIAQSLGYFTGAYRPDFYIYFTDLSNYLCWIVMFIYMIAAIKMACKHEDGAFKKGNTFFFCCCISILLTCLVFNILLTAYMGISVSEYFGSFDFYGLHTLLPVMFILFWILFFEHKYLRWYAPLLGVVIPLIYVGLIYMRAGIYLSLGETSETMTLYPYYFMNPDEIAGWEVALYIVGLCVIFIGIGYLFVFFDNIGNFGKNKKNRKPKKEQEEVAIVDYGDVSLEDENTFNEEITIRDVEDRKKKKKDKK